MSKAFEVIYERGGFRLGWDRTREGALRSPNLQISWYEQGSGRLKFQTAGTADVDVAKLALDQKYVESTGGACAFCPQCGQSMADKDYLVLDAMTDYFDERGRRCKAHDSVKARLKHFLQFLEATKRTELICARLDDHLADTFRDWSQSVPVVSRNKGGEVTRTRSRSPATTEETLIQLRAALNWACRKKRIDAVPFFAVRTREDVSPVNTTRVGIDVIAKMLAHAAASPRRSALHGFLMASICTLGRPDAVFDISVRPDRGQWKRGDHILKLNPTGRRQTRKHRAVVAVPPQLGTWLEATAGDIGSNGWLVNWRGERVNDVDSSWDSMLEALGLPIEREHKSYLMRRSMATILRNWHHEAGRTKVDGWELEAQLGHRRRSRTEIYALASPNAKDTVQTALQEVLAELERLAPGALHRKDTGRAAPTELLRLVA